MTLPVCLRARLRDSRAGARYGVNSVLDTPRLVFLDQRVTGTANRQRVYKGEISEEGVIAFLREAGLTALDADTGAGKDEL